MLIKKAEARRGQGLLEIILTKELYWKGKERRRNIGKGGEQRGLWEIQYGERVEKEYWKMREEMEGYLKEFGEGMEYEKRREGRGEE